VCRSQIVQVLYGSEMYIRDGDCDLDEAKEDLLNSMGLVLLIPVYGNGQEINFTNLTRRPIGSE